MQVGGWGLLLSLLCCQRRSCHMMRLHSPPLALQLRSPWRVPVRFRLFLHHFYSGLALLALNGVVDNLLWYKWITEIHLIIWTRYFVGLSFILHGVLWARKEEFCCESLF